MALAEQEYWNNSYQTYMLVMRIGIATNHEILTSYFFLIDVHMEAGAPWNQIFEYN